MTGPVVELAAGDAVTVTVPASSANLGPGYDSVGLGLDLRDTYAVRVTSEPGLVVDLQGQGAQRLPRDDSSLLARALRTAMEACGLGWLEELRQRGLGLHLTYGCEIPMSAGLGSSAAAGVGGFALGFALARQGELTSEDRALVNTHAGILEGHPDNSSASVYGGLTVSWMPSPQAVRTARLTVHEDVAPLVVVPVGSKLSTRTARAVLPPHIAHADAARQASRSALLIHALTTDPTFLLDATQDWLHQEYRREAYPTSMAAVDLLRAQGHAAVVSGAGPTVLVLTRRAVVDTIAAEVKTWGREWKLLRPAVASEGVRVV